MLDIRWRPSGGRGEYEYRVSSHAVLGKHAIVQVPVLGVSIATDVRFDHVDGKPRLRRDNQNDRATLNLPPLVTSIAGLPQPRREDKSHGVAYPLSKRSYVVDSILFDVIKEGSTSVTLEPKLIKPRHAADYIDVEDRIRLLVSQEGARPAVKTLLDAIRSSANTATLATLADGAHSTSPYSPDLGVAAPPTDTDDIIADYTGTEGAVSIREHRYRERNQKVVKAAKRIFKKRHGKLFCQCCGIDFAAVYPQVGDDFIEAHHKVPLHKLDEQKETRASDLAMLCSNCHRMVHKVADCSVEAIRKLLADNETFIDRSNLDLLAD